jgi:predicted transcriptional regulator
MADGQAGFENPGAKDLKKTLVMEMTADIVASYVRKNSVPASELPILIRGVFDALQGITGTTGPANKVELKPAVPVKKSVTDEYIVCLEDGKKFKSLKRHLRAKYGMSPEEYREKWNLPADYPMVSPSYARERSRLAKKMGLGQARS